MSSDVGYILRNDSAGKFVLQAFFMSADEFPPIEDAADDKRFDTLGEAIFAYAEIAADDRTQNEYGMFVDLDVEDRDVRYRLFACAVEDE